ncbi:hypothetical protein GCM10009414_14180 [Tatumella terrea]
MLPQALPRGECRLLAVIRFCFAERGAGGLRLRRHSAKGGDKLLALKESRQPRVTERRGTGTSAGTDNARIALH